MRSLLPLKWGILFLIPNLLHSQSDSINRLDTVTVIAPATLTGAGHSTWPQVLPRQALDISAVPMLLNNSDNLNLIPGLSTFEGTAGTAKFSYRGMGSRTQYTTSRSLIYLGEIPITSLQGFSTFEDLNPLWFIQPDMVRNEGLEHPLALGGVLQYQARRLPYDMQEIQDLPPYRMLFSEVKVGSFQYWQSNSYFFSRAQNFTVMGGYENSSKQGWRDNNELQRQSVYLNANWHLPEQSRLELITYGLKSRVEIPSSLNRQDFENSPQQAAESWARIEGYKQYESLISGLTYSNAPRATVHYKLSVFYRYLDNFEGRPFNILQEVRHSRGFRGVLERKKILWKNTESMFSIFGEYQLGNEDLATYQNTYDSLLQTYNHPGDLLNETVLFARRFNGGVQWNTFYRLDNADRKFWRFALGINSAFQENRYTEAAETTFDLPWQWAPVLGLHYIDKDKGLQPFVKLYRSFSIPALEENLDPDGSINRSLKPETAWTAEGGIGWQITASSVHFLQLNYYYSVVENLIVPRLLAPDQVIATNSGSSLHRGIEFSLSRQKDEFRKWDPRWQVSGYWGKFNYREFSDTAGDYSANELPAFPQWQFNASLELVYRVQAATSVSLGVMGRATAAYYVDDENREKTAPFYLLQTWLRLRRDFGKSFTGSLSLGLRNVGNESYAAMTVVNNRAFGGAAPRYFYPGEPRNFYGGLSLSYSF